jgi:hypothetical protein
MTHLFKIPLQNSDMFVKSIDFNTKLIDYSIRDKETGNLLEPSSITPFTIDGNKLNFGSRFIALEYAKIIQQLLTN